MNYEEAIKEFNEFVAQAIPEIVSYIVKKDPCETIKYEVNKIYKHKERMALKRSGRSNLTEGEVDKLIKLSFLIYSNKFGYRNFIEQIKTKNHYLIFLGHILASTHGFNRKDILSIGSGICIPELFASKKIFTNTRVICVDFANNNLVIAKNIAKKNEVSDMEFIVADAERLPFKKDKKFSSIWLLGGLSFDKDLRYKEKIESMSEETVVSM